MPNLIHKKKNMTQERWNQILKEKNKKCNELSKHLKQILKNSGIDVPVRKYDYTRIEIRCFLIKERTEKVVRCISENHPEWQFESNMTNFYANNICISIL